jgi:hypothetical protein
MNPSEPRRGAASKNKTIRNIREEKETHIAHRPETTEPTFKLAVRHGGDNRANQHKEDRGENLTASSLRQEKILRIFFREKLSHVYFLIHQTQLYDDKPSPKNASCTALFLYRDSSKPAAFHARP